MGLGFAGGLGNGYGGTGGIQTIVLGETIEVMVENNPALKVIDTDGPRVIIEESTNVVFDDKPTVVIVDDGPTQTEQ